MIEDSTIPDEISANDDGHIDLPRPVEFSGYISESLFRHLQSENVRIIGQNASGQELEFELSLSGKFINAAVVCFGQVSGRAGCVAVQTDSGEWHYTKDWRHDLQIAAAAKNTTSIFAKVHLYHR